jgi:hypothetical protein
MINRIPFRKGDDVRVKMPTHDGYLWHCATVLRDTDDGLHVEFASGMKAKIPHGEDRYERVTEAG